MLTEMLRPAALLRKTRLTALRRLLSQSVLSLPLFLQQTQLQPLSSRHSFVLKQETVSSSARIPVLRRAQLRLPRLFLKLLLRQALRRVSSAGLIFLHSNSQTHLCRKLTASSQQAAPAWLRLLIHQVSLHSVLAPVTHLLSLMKQLTFYSQLTQLSTQRHLITV